MPWRIVPLSMAEAEAEFIAACRRWLPVFQTSTVGASA
jgi:hypothetical protein